MNHFFSLGLGLLLVPTLALAQAPTIVTRLPAANAVAVPRTTAVELTFSQAMSAQTAAPDAVRVVSQWRGLLPGTYSGAGTSTIRFQPGRYFLPGETVTVGVTTRATSLSGGTPAVPSQYQFTAQVPGGTGRFGAAFDNVAVGTSPRSVALGDVNGDGKLDFVTANYNANSASVRLGNGAGGFSGTTEVSVGTQPASVALGDANGDGKLDIVTANNNSSANTASVRLGDGAGGFSGTTDVSVGINPYSVALGDIDGDGDLDLLTANNNSNTVSPRLNGGGTTGAAIPLPVELMAFTARRQDTRQVQLRWTTAQELHNAGFAVEKSVDGHRWQRLGFVPGQGSTTTAHQYSYADAEAGAAYYRLVQQDQDGAQTSSPVRYVAGGRAPALQLFPNPATGTVQLLGATAEVELLSLQGQPLRHYPAGTQQLDLRGLPAGLYLLRSGQQAIRLVVE